MKQFLFVALAAITIWNVSAGFNGSGIGGSTLAAEFIGVAPQAGLIVQKSENDFDTTYSRARAAIEKLNGVRIVNEIDHQKNAEGRGLAMRPARLILFANPNVGTPLMVASPSAAIDLPLRMAVYEEKDGTVALAYVDPAFFASRHALPVDLEQINMLKKGLGSIAAAAVGK